MYEVPGERGPRRAAGSGSGSGSLLYRVLVGQQVPKYTFLSLTAHSIVYLYMHLLLYYSLG